MLVFGDAARTVCPRDEIFRLLAEVRQLRDAEPGLAAHAALASAFIDAAELAQGISDAIFDAEGVDGAPAEERAASELVMILARALHRSWGDGLSGRAATIEAAAARLLGLALPSEIRCKRAEGYAFYALYPEAYLEAARRLRGVGPLRVIGIRSTGIGLAALVATAAGAGTPLSVRPVGHPFSRRIVLSDAVAASLADTPGGVAVVDEGPGLSGSSFGAVLDALEAKSVGRNRLHVFPGHAGDLGPEASPAHRERWAGIPRHVVDFEALVLRSEDPRRRLETWFADLTGTPRAPLQDLSGGAWRTLHFADEALWPPAHVGQERRKYLLRSDRGTWLLKFAGLGRYGREKLPRAAALGDAGFIQPVAGLRHGFLAERWAGDARPLDPARIDRDRLVGHLGAYLGFRSRHFPVERDAGGTPAALAEMLRHNARAGLGEAPAPELDRFCEEAEALAPQVRRVATDNRLHPWEWLERPDGRLVKLDALDHCATHDLVGPQDIGWDIAGAVAEFDLSDAEAEALLRAVEAASGHAVNRALLRFLTPCYLAFQLGAASMARDSLGHLPAEAGRLAREADRYRGRLAAHLARSL